MVKQVKLKRHNRNEEKIMEAVNRYCKGRNVSYANLTIIDNEIVFTTYCNDTYENLVNKLVAERYTIQDELAIQRKSLTEKTDEFYLYNAYVEQCKLDAKQFIEQRNKALEG